LPAAPAQEGNKPGSPAAGAQYALVDVECYPLRPTVTWEDRADDATVALSVHAVKPHDEVRQQDKTAVSALDVPAVPLLFDAIPVSALYANDTGDRFAGRNRVESAAQAVAQLGPRQTATLQIQQQALDGAGAGAAALLAQHLPPRPRPTDDVLQDLFGGAGAQVLGDCLVRIPLWAD